MLSVYQFEGSWVVTYQRNSQSEIITLYEGFSETEAYEIIDRELEEWG